MALGDVIDFREPNGLLVYKGHGHFSIRPDKKSEPKVRKFRHVGMVAGGTVWSYSSGFVTDDMMKDHLPAPSTDVLVVLCGPPPTIQKACVPNLDKLGYRTENIFAY